MYYRDENLNLYKIIDETGPLYVCECIKGPKNILGRIVNFHKVTGKRI